ncbi:hypothetical protein GIB67_022964 [Kingdonia uniflora]|uniref:S-adenosyl-L-methionine-dependent methyltransferase n=1 Tax=Kingdonia uniflora TaxID=39325 RepID=A0A7J7P2E6_9MAGN|nr:hypothetical protein GIB67_022964 [Kingdonia uniflora]
MGCFADAAVVGTPFICSFITKKRGVVLRAKLNDEDDPFFQNAINGASLRFQESNKPEPLFLDTYAGCFLTHDSQKDMKHCLLSGTSTSHFCLATKFIDDKLLNVVNHMDGVRQIVLLTDGMDTRPYRLKWPNSTIIFDISPNRVFQRAAQKLEDVGAKIAKSCLFIHVPSESSNIQEMLCRKSFNGSRPSIWVVQGLTVLTLASFKEILLTVGSLAMKGCIFLGELPSWLVETEVGAKTDACKWIDKLFMSNGFRVDVITYEEVARNLGLDPPPRDSDNILFMAEQLRFSDDQMETWRREFQRVEEEGDEEGFEEL